MNTAELKNEPMRANNFVRQWIKDGLGGVGVAFLLFIPMNAVTGSSLGAVFLMLPPLILIVIITSFLGTGFGAHLLTNVSSRADWLLRLFKVSLFSWLVAMGLLTVFIVLYSPEYWRSAVYFLPAYTVSAALGAGIGFVIAGLIGAMYYPVSRSANVVLSSMVSTFTGFVLVYTFMLALTVPT